ncbi:MAG TPA: amidohydrolase [Methylomirabilota bacterium]|jgi:amidohydrolase|nr:amidohydrolase [Methylomirabilota bacterium]
MDALKRRVADAVERLGDELTALSLDIHAHPELAFEETHAADRVGRFLAEQGFKVEAGVGGIPTAFRASLETGPGPTLAILCEYDALPGVGHACGHNVIAAAGAGAGAALMAARDGLPSGRVVVIGTPAEERGGGKGCLVEAGLFRDVDAAMMIHGFDRTLLHQDLLGVARVTFEWEGRAAHASVDPWEGVNALDACVATFNGVAMLRQQMRPDCRIHGVVAEGGIAGNIIPERAVADFNVRGPSLEAMWALHRRVVACAEAAALATATRLTVTRHPDVYEPMRRNQGLLDVFAANLGASGLAEGPAAPDRLASSDIGNVSQVTPTIHAWVQIAALGTAIHTREFATAATAPSARVGLLAGAKLMALSAVDLLADPSRLRVIKEEFTRR